MRTAAWWCMGLLAACGHDPTPTAVPDKRPDKEKLMTAEQQAMRIESLDIDGYVARHGLKVNTTGTGLRWQMIRDSAGPNARPEELVTVNYKAELIDGKECYASAPAAPESFRVEHDDVESGLHEGIQLMSPGDSAILIIPSHRAFGLIGDRDKIPMRSTVIYFIGLVKTGGGK